MGPALAALVASYLAVTGITLACGLLLTKVLTDHGVGQFDAHVASWLAERRTEVLNEITKWATNLANTEPVVAVAAVAALILAVRRQWRELVFLLSALLIEITVFLSVNLLVARPRPNVIRLNDAPITSSYPSGHAAASLVLWGAIGVIVTMLSTNLVPRVLAWIPLAIMSWLVPFARLYRGMHFFTDVICGLVLGLLALGGGVLVARTWVAGCARRRGPAMQGPAEDEPLESLAALR